MSAVAHYYEILIFLSWQFGDFRLQKFILQYVPEWVFNSSAWTRT